MPSSSTKTVVTSAPRLTGYPRLNGYARLNFDSLADLALLGVEGVGQADEGKKKYRPRNLKVDTHSEVLVDYCGKR